MRTLLTLALIGLWFLTVPPVRAASPTTALSADYKRCVDAHTTNRDWAVCGDQEIARQEAEVTDVWKAAYAAMKQNDPKAADDLLREQRAWIRFKDSACDYYYDDKMTGRESQVLDFAICKASLIAERIRFLREFPLTDQRTGRRLRDGSR